ncbi:MAG: hypothetical protein ACI89L_001435, partial [Phycisphaerales bacterium]
TELKAFNAKIKKPCADLKKLDKEADPLLKKKKQDRSKDEVKKLDIMAATRKSIQDKMFKEMISTEARINKTLKGYKPPPKEEQKKLPLPSWISKDGLRLTDKASLNGDVDFKKMKFSLKLKGTLD